MARLLYHIDEIARRKEADVLWIAFEYEAPGSLEGMSSRLRQHRAEIVFWLEQRKISYERCFGDFGGALEESYRGDLFIDLPIDRSNNDFLELEAMLENPNGSAKIEGSIFYHMPLRATRKNTRFYKKIMSHF